MNYPFKDVLAEVLIIHEQQSKYVEIPCQHKS